MTSLKLRYLKSYFRFWFGLIWAAAGTLLAVIFTAIAVQQEAVEGAANGMTEVGRALGITGGLVVGAIGFGLVFSALRQSDRRVELLRSGTRATGTVVAVELKENIKINRRHPVFLRVAYKDELGRDHQSESAWLPPAMDSRWQPGDPVRVVYDPFEPTRCEVDIFDASRA